MHLGSGGLRGGSEADVAVERLAASLAEPGAMDAQRFEAFLALQRRIGLTHAGRALCQYLTPCVLSAGEYAAIARATELLSSALGRVAELAAHQPDLARELGMTAQEQALAAIDPGYPQPLAVGRFDMLIGAHGFDFIELNADSPAGITDQLLVERALFTMPHVQALRQSMRCRTPAPHNALIAALRELYAAWGGTAQYPKIALVDWQDVATADESEVLVALLREAGHAAFFVDPSELEYDGVRLSARGEAIDLVYRRVIVQELLDRCGMEHALIRAYRDRKVCVANSFRTKALNKKASFALLSDPEFGGLFSAEEHDAIEAHVPWTRRLASGRTRYRGREEALETLLLDQPERFVLKPNDEYGGHGVLLGWQAPPEVWAHAVKGGADRGLIVQERRTPRTLRMPSYRDGGLVFDHLYFDLCPFVFAGRMGGAMTRVSHSPVTNVSAGAFVSALLVVEDSEPDEPGKEAQRV